MEPWLYMYSIYKMHLQNAFEWIPNKLILSLSGWIDNYAFNLTMGNNTTQST